MKRPTTKARRCFETARRGAGPVKHHHQEENLALRWHAPRGGAHYDALDSQRARPQHNSSFAMSALIKLLGPMQAKILAAGAAGGAAVGTWQWQQARQALQSSGKSFDEIFDAADKDKNGTVDGEQSSRTPG